MEKPPVGRELQNNLPNRRLQVTYVEDSMHEMPFVFKPQFEFMSRLIGALSAFDGHATMANLSRYGAGSARAIARWCRHPFGFTAFNLTMLALAGVLENETLLAVLDCTFLPKSGKSTWGVGKYYNGCASRPEWGLEACVLGLADLEENTAYTVDACQTPAELPEGWTRMDFYLSVVRRSASQLLEHTQHLLIDGGLSSQTFIDGVVDLGLHPVGKLRRDSRLRYLYDGPRREGPGRPRLYDGQVDYNYNKLAANMQRIEADWTEDEVFSQVVNHPCWKRNLRVVILVRHRNGKRRHVILFSTDTELSAEQIVRWYSLRFQIEFVFRDAKQFTGLGDAQVRDRKGQHFFINASLSTLNSLRLQDRDRRRETGSTVVSISSCKRRKYNEMLVDRIYSSLGLDPIVMKSDPTYRKACQFGAIAA